MALRKIVPALAVCGLGMLVGIGCGSAGGPKPPMGKVHGKVLLNGKPVTKGIVTFIPIPGKGGETGQSASGPIESDGSFSLTTFNSDDGAIQGQHKATVREDFTSPAPDSGSGSSKTTGQMPDFSKKASSKSARPTIPARYADPESTPLKYTVDPGNNDFTIELKD